MDVRQLTFGPKNHFFGYIGHCNTIPWNSSGRYILALRCESYQRMPEPREPADVVLIDTHDGNRVIHVDRTLAWNPQQGTMFYWNPASAETQFLFNDQDPGTGDVFTVLYDVVERRRVREYRFDDTPVGNQGVMQGGGSFFAVNYGRLARLRRVTGYAGARDWSQGPGHLDTDGVFRVNIETGEKELVAPFRRMIDLLPYEPDPDVVDVYINHCLCNRDDNRVMCILRGRGMESWFHCFTFHPDGSSLKLHEGISGHPEWVEGSLLVTTGPGFSLYDVDKSKFVGSIAGPDVFPDTQNDSALAPNGRLYVGSHQVPGGNHYVIYDRQTGESITSPLVPSVAGEGDTRIDPAPAWNRSSDALLVPGVAEDGTRQMFVVEL